MCPARNRARTVILATLCATALGLLIGRVHAQMSFRASSVAFSAPETLVRLEPGDWRGEPARLAWSPDGSQLYLQTLVGGFGRPDALRHHYVFALPGGTRRELHEEPEWAADYWTMKSARTSPDRPERNPLRIELKSEKRQERTTSLPGGGDLARGGTTPAITEADQANIANQQVIGVHTMLLHGETVGEFVNSVIVPGLTYGWAPEGTKLIAYASQNSGRIVVMDETGGKKEVPGSKDAILPAWSQDLGRIAWLQKDGRRAYALKVARVAVAQ